MSERTYPIPLPDYEPRFTEDLSLDIERVLILHGYPPIEHRRDIAELQLALYTFLYGPTVIDR